MTETIYLLESAPCVSWGILSWGLIGIGIRTSLMISKSIDGATYDNRSTFEEIGIAMSGIPQFFPYLILDENQRKFKDCFANNNKIGLLKKSYYSIICD